MLLGIYKYMDRRLTLNMKFSLLNVNTEHFWQKCAVSAELIDLMGRAEPLSLNTLFFRFPTLILRFHLSSHEKAATVSL